MSLSRLGCRGSFADVVTELVSLSTTDYYYFLLPYFLHATPSDGLHSSLDGNTGRLQLLIL